MPLTPVLKTEIIRKSIHFLIALTPSLAAVSRFWTLILLCSGIFFYIMMEILRIKGLSIPLISFITVKASRQRDKGFVWGPVTLGAGSVLTLILFPHPIASVSIYALAFGDGLSSLAGRLFGRIHPAFLRGKSLEGSLVCFIAVFISTFLVFRTIRESLITAFVVMVAEALPLKDCDNIVIPLAAGITLSLFFNFFS